MKRIILLLIPVLLIRSESFGQLYPKPIVICGYVKDMNNVPVPDHAVTIFSDSIHTHNFFYYKTVKTFEDGFYIDTIRIPNDPNIKLSFNVWTLGCNNEYLDKTINYDGTFQYYANFTICSPEPTECRADFYTFKDSSDGGNSLTYRFINTSEEGYSSQYQWDLGDFTVTNERNPVHKYLKPGKYNVCLTITTAYSNGYTCTDKYCKEIDITGLPPSGDCNAYFNFYKNDSISSSMYAYQFIDKSYGAKKANFWSWTFGDNTYSNEQNPLHKFPKPGTYKVCLKIASYTDSTNYACTDYYCQDVTVFVNPPNEKCVAGFYYYGFSNGTDTVYPGDTIKPLPENTDTYYFVNTSRGKNIIKYFWNFGDGSYSNEQNPIHTYQKEGEYKVCLTITSSEDSSNNCTDSYCEIISTIPVNKCFADFYYIPNDSTGITGVSFFNTSQGYSNRFTWEFGDGITSNEENPVHIYDQPGIYEVCLSIENDSLKCYDTRCNKVFAGNKPDICRAYFTYYPNDSSALDVMYNYMFVDLSKGNIKYWYWDFGDGTTSEQRNPAHIFPAPGYYDVCLTISDSTNAGCFDIYCQTIYVGKPFENCKAAFYSWHDSTVNTPNYYHFADFSQGNPERWHWTFGDGSSSEEQNPNHQYLKTGTYHVCLFISNGSTNCIDSVCNYVYVGTNPNPCYVKFTYSLDSTGTSIPEVFEYKFYPYASGNIISYQWDFVDGSMSNEKNPVHGFYPGTHNVCLTATIQTDSNTVCNATYCDKIILDTIMPPPPEKNCYNFFTFSINPASDSSLSVKFNAYSAPGLLYQWDFGDGITAISKENHIIHNYQQKADYKVCLTTFSQDSSNCEYTSCQNIFGGNGQDSTYYLGSISGHIYAGNDYADKGFVTIVQMDNSGNISYFDAAQIEGKGFYHFDNIPYGGYYVYAALYPGSIYFKKYLPTFYGDTWHWADAKSVGVGDYVPTDNIDIHLVPVKPHKKGNCFIGGQVSDKSYKAAKGAPVANVEVLLLDEFDQPLGITYTDKSGYFRFSDIDFGTYKIFVEVMGLQTITATINLNEENPSADNVNFSIDQVKAMPMTDLYSGSCSQVSNLKSQISQVYPNPVNDNASINISQGKESVFTYAIYNQVGQLIHSSDINFPAGNHRITFSTASLTKGIYFIKISSADNTSVMRRFVKAN